MTADRIDKARPHLHTDGVHKQNQAEFLDEVEHIRFHTDSKVTKSNAHKERSGTTQANSLDLNLSDHQTECRRNGNRKDLLAHRGLRK